MARTFGTVGVVGLGTMGAGIAEVAARAGLSVVAVDADAAGLTAGRGHVERSTGRAVRRGRLTAEDQQALLDRITFASGLEALAGCDLVVEAVPERLDLKRRVLAGLDDVVGPGAVLATNTSSLSVTEIAVATADPRRVVGLHFFNPAPVQRLVEVVRTVVTDDAVVDDVVALAGRLGKQPVVVGDRAGFIANALLFGYLNRAVSMFEQHHVSREDLDAAARLGCGLPMGPLALLDLIGLDTAVEILETMHEQGRDRLHAPAPVLKQLVAAGLTGRKSGRGFYTYAEPGSGQVVADRLTPGPQDAAPPVRAVQRVAVVGSGTVASALAAVVARGGLEVVVVVGPAERGDVVRGEVAHQLEQAVAGERLDDAGRQAALARLTTTAELAAVGGCDLVVEALSADLSTTQALLRQVDELARPGAVLATTTSSLPVVALAAATTRPRDVVGLHLPDPARGVPLVEVVRALDTADDVVATAVDLCHRLGVQPVTCADRAGFVVDALLLPYLNDAVKMVQARYASADDVDTAMTLGCGYPTGPFALLDAIGLDVALAGLRAISAESREPGLAPAPLLVQLVSAGHLGRRTGRGFRTYPS